MRGPPASGAFAEPLVDRDDERAELRALVSRAQPSLALLTGRRRVGKTFLLAHTWPSEQFFLFTAARTSAELNRRQLVQDISAWSGDHVRPEDAPTWRAIFRLLVSVARQRAARSPSLRTVMVLDEFQYLADGDAGLAAVASELNAVWESREVAGSPGAPLPLLVVLAGSAVHTMEALAGGGSPLYGRFDWTHALQPFTYWHAAELAGFTTMRDRARAYGIFGGTPRYLAAIDARRSLAENVTSLLLSPRGEVRTLVETSLDQEDGLRDVSKYRAVLRAVADGCTRRNDIALRTGLSNDHALREKLGTLTALGYLQTRANLDAKPNDAVRYRLADAAFRFFHRFVAPNASILERYPADRVWTESVAPHLDSWMGHEFERIAIQAYDRRASALGLPLVPQWGRWEGVDRARQSLEIDIVAPLTDGRCMTGSVKWDQRPVGARVHHEHMDMLRRAADAGRAWAHDAVASNAPLFYVAAGGFTAGFRAAVAASGHPAILWSLADVFDNDVTI